MRIVRAVVCGFVVALIPFSMVLLATAEEPPTGEPATESEAADAEALVRQLDDNQFARREEASRAIERLGLPTIAALSRVAERGSVEASRRAFQLLERFANSADVALRGAARTALETISVGASSAAAERAKDLLATIAGRGEDAAQQQAQQDRPRAGGRFPFLELLPQLEQRGGVLLRGGVPGVNSRTVVRNNDSLQIVVTENDRKVSITEDPTNGITVEVTEPQADAQADDPAENARADGQENAAVQDAGQNDAEPASTITRRYVAKDAAELEANHPEAFELYQRYAAQNEVAAPLLPEGLFPRDLFPEDFFQGGQLGEGFFPPGFDEEFLQRFRDGLPLELGEPEDWPRLFEQEPGELQQQLRERMQQRMQQLQRRFKELQRPTPGQRQQQDQPPEGQQRDDPPKVEQEVVDRQDVIDV
ncbi:MAG: hypothetical protein DWQ31_05265 [Planctomycetota bacterium]|nr:MAG: hypothetical protein DWQ31_05265 [Planctomycetota bacterium]REJ97599.1 MAG: hypothetical protein DWQ35_01675 [Planctomycetota bacterium]REK23021.1 MAG: hypothetical protein DWQ42_15975 [Planctomycetota bacterium]REK43384.1 MAG: hypothetical protein DWQ46_11675 [Planctomycetota bacterium]